MGAHRSTVGWSPRRAITSMPRSACLHSPAKMDIVEIIMGTQQMMTGFRSGHVWVQRVSHQATCCSLEGRYQLFREIALTLTIARPQSWMAPRTCAKKKSTSSFHPWHASSMCASEATDLQMTSEQNVSSFICGSGDVYMIATLHRVLVKSLHVGGTEISLVPHLPSVHAIFFLYVCQMRNRSDQTMAQL